MLAFATRPRPRFGGLVFEDEEDDENVTGVHGRLDDSEIVPWGRWPSRAGRKAPINRTHSKRFALAAESAEDASAVWSACAFSAAFPRQPAIRGPGRFTESLLGLAAMHWDHEHDLYKQPNDKLQMPKEIRRSNVEGRSRVQSTVSSFGFRYSFGFGYSSFVLENCG